jgi:hypothetical protein
VLQNDTHFRIVVADLERTGGEHQAGVGIDAGFLRAAAVNE